MRHVDLSVKMGRQDDGLLVARKVRHLDARLHDFGPGGPEVVTCDQEQGMVCARFPEHETQQVLAGLSSSGVEAAMEGDMAVFYLSDRVSFEDLDYVWGCLFNIL